MVFWNFISSDFYNIPRKITLDATLRPDSVGDHRPGSKNFRPGRLVTENMFFLKQML
jgi:hypothetical protein